ncbi:15-hydroxyprostaglandin dehydrogenase [NAD(+)]-like isoform X2 [Ostrea edulis]|uniref:15-hydroxyprostaglandin dehydrogenase [NAD(+)]-like isoform X2 n=1 Tax=Ostrea edulis TaxID=37623 RepID=UPI0024AF7CB2|nr:15-hydroxyprostaglandin dehydrogenase [NAD(+)]-like isoform X2 [Ostrea edulis]
MLLDGKVALVTGGVQGLGKAFAEELLKSRVKVCICDLNVDAGEKTVREWKLKYGNNAMFLQCDVTDHSQFEDVFKLTIARFGGLDIVVNNAGVLVESQSWRTTIMVNVIGVIEGTKLADQYMNKQNGGRGGVVINIASTAGLTPVFFMPVYVASKYSVVGYTKSVAMNPAIDSTGMRFVCLCPGFTDTSMLTEGGKEDVSGKDEAEQIVQSAGVNTVESVVEAFMQLLLTDDNNGGVMAVTKQRGIQYHGRRRKVNKL